MAVSTYPSVSQATTSLPVGSSGVLFDGQLVTAASATRTVAIPAGNYYAYFSSPGIVVFNDGSSSTVSTALSTQSISVSSSKTSVSVYASPYSLNNATLLPVSQTWVSATYGADRYLLASGSSNAYTISTNGTTWGSGSLTFSGVSPSGFDTAQYVGTNYVVHTSTGNGFFVSTDASSWKLAGSWSGLPFLTGGYSGTTHYAGCGNTSGPLSSTNGVLWTATGTATATALAYLKKVNNVWWGSPTYLTASAGQVGGPFNNIGSTTWSASTDFVTWASKATANIADLAHNGTVYGAIGAGTYYSFQLFSSTDGVTWTQRTAPIGWGTGTGNNDGSVGLSIAWGNGRFACAYSCKTGLNNRSAFLATSTDAVTWAVNTSLSQFNLVNYSGNNTLYNRIAYAGSQFIVTAPNTNYHATSTDSLTWTFRTAVATHGSRLLHNGSRYVSCGDYATTVSSTDGITWTQGSALDTISYAWVSNTTFFATGSNNTLMSSTDGITWAFVSGYGTYVAGKPFSKSTTNGSVYANVKYNTAIAQTSPDGLTWTERTLPSTANWIDVAYGNGVFTAIAYNDSKAATSTDGITWAARTLPATLNWQAITYGNSTFVAIATGSSSAATSTDGITWTAGVLPTNTTWVDIIFHNGYFVAVSTSTACAISTNGIIWVPTTSSYGMSELASNGTTQLVGAPTGATQQYAVYSTGLSTAFGIYTGPTTVY